MSQVAGLSAVTDRRYSAEPSQRRRIIKRLRWNFCFGWSRWGSQNGFVNRAPYLPSRAFFSFTRLEWASLWELMPESISAFLESRRHCHWRRWNDFYLCCGLVFGSTRLPVLCLCSSTRRRNSRIRISTRRWCSLLSPLSICASSGIEFFAILSSIKHHYPHRRSFSRRPRCCFGWLRLPQDV